MSTVLVVAPHPDDETLGAGGTLLRHRREGDAVHWAIATDMGEGFPEARRAARDREIEAVAAHYGFAGVHRLGFPAASLDGVPRGELIGALGDVVRRVEPEVIYLPFPGDAHTDHRVVFEAGAACTKWFRYPWVRRVLAYETLSETDFGIDPTAPGFDPQVFVDIGETLEGKLAAMALFEGELGEFPFPRSAEAIRAQATLRGAAAGCVAAEAFMLLRERR